MFRICLHGFDRVIEESMEFAANDQASAQRAFESLVARDDLAGERKMAVLLFDQEHLATHRFDREPRQPHCWTDRVSHIHWPYPDQVLTDEPNRRVVRGRR